MINRSFGLGSDFQISIHDEGHELIEWLSIAPSLTHLSYFTNIVEYPEIELKNNSFPCLRELTITSSTLKYLPKFIFNLHQLDRLSIKCPKISNIDEVILLDTLKELSIWECNIDRIPDDICKIKSLECLAIIDCPNLKNLPDSIGQLKNLDRIAVSNTGIKRHPRLIKGLEKVPLINTNRSPCNGQAEDIIYNERD